MTSHMHSDGIQFVPHNHGPVSINNALGTMSLQSGGETHMTLDSTTTQVSKNLQLADGVGIVDSSNASILPEVTVYNVGTTGNDIQVIETHPGAGTTTVSAGNFQAIAVRFGDKVQVTLQGDINNDNPATYTDGSGASVNNPNYNQLLQLPFALRPNHTHEFVIAQADPSSSGSTHKSLGVIQIDADGKLIRVDSSFIPATSTNTAPDRYKRVEGAVYWIQ